jgi:hypothetical protein
MILKELFRTTRSRPIECVNEPFRNHADLREDSLRIVVLSLSMGPMWNQRTRMKNCRSIRVHDQVPLAVTNRLIAR